MSEKFTLGIDNGGTLTKAAIYNMAGEVQAIAQTKLTIHTPSPLFTERDLDEAWQANIAAIRDCLAQSKISPDQIAAVAVTGHGNGIYLTKKDGRGSRPGVISTDGRAQSYIDDWLSRPEYAKRIRSKTGSTVWAGQPVSLLAWFNDNEPEVFDETDYVLFAKDYIRFRLTGEAKSEITDASGCGFMDIVKTEIDPELFEMYGISNWLDKIPEICESTDIAGYITPEVAELTGLKAGTPVAGGMMDVAAGAVAAGLTNDHELCTITGTWSINEFLTSQPNTSQDVFLTLRYPIQDRWLVLEGSPNGVSNLDWFLRNTIKQTLSKFAGKEISDGELFKTCETLIDSITPSLDDPIYLPYINGTSDIPDGRAGFEGLTAYHDISHIIRAVYEGVIFSHMCHVNNLRSYDELLGGHIRFTGGATNSPMWMKMFANGLGTPLDVVNAEESGTLGSAIASAVAAELYPDMATAIGAMTSAPRETVFPDEKESEFFQARFEKFEEILRQRNNIPA